MAHSTRVNPRQEAFVEAYARHGNGTRAAKEAGYPEKSAHVAACRLLKNDKILLSIREVQSARFRALHMDADEVLALVAGQARNPLQNMLHITDAGDPYIDLAKASPEDLAHIQEVMIEDFTDGRAVDPETGETIKREVRRVKVKMASPDAARSTLMKHLGLMKEQVELTVTESAADIMAAAHERARRARAEREGEG